MVSGLRSNCQGCGFEPRREAFLKNAPRRARNVTGDFVKPTTWNWLPIHLPESATAEWLTLRGCVRYAAVQAYVSRATPPQFWSLPLSVLNPILFFNFPGAQAPKTLDQFLSPQNHSQHLTLDFHHTNLHLCVILSGCKMNLTKPKSNRTPTKMLHIKSSNTTIAVYKKAL